MTRFLMVLTAVFSAAGFFLFGEAVPTDTNNEDAIWHHRNLGKAFYENSTTQLQAVEEFKKALDLAPESARERVNYGLALLRAGKTPEGVAELLRAQQQDPSIPHTWFNLGITYKKDSEYEKAIQQFEQMIKLVKDEPVSRYNLGVLYKLTGKQEQALQMFEVASKLDRNLAGPHFQLYNAYRQLGRADDSARELALFQEIKKRQAGAAVPEDLDWSYYAEIYETVEPRRAAAALAELRFDDQTLPGKIDGAGAGLAVADVDGDAQPDLIAWGAQGVSIYKGAASRIEKSGLEDVKGVRGVAPGDLNNDGLVDLCILTEGGVALYQNLKGEFQKNRAPIPSGTFGAAVWLDYDHDYDLDLFLLGSKPALYRNNGTSGFSDQTADFPFVKGDAVAGTAFDLIADTNGFDLIVGYRDHPGVLYRDRLAGRYEAVTLEGLSAGTTALIAADLNNDSWTDVVASDGGKVLAGLNRLGKLEFSTVVSGAGGPVCAVDFNNRALSDLVVRGSIYRSDGLGGFAPAAAAAPGAAAALAASDFDGNGKTDLAAVAEDGSIHLMRNTTPVSNAWLRVALTGVKNLKLAPGAEIEVKTGTSYQKRTYDGTPALFGLADAKIVDTVRITWPNGTIQNQPKQAVNRSEIYKEAQRLSGSCPMIFTWNGTGFEFITDVLGVAPLGASSGNGEFFPVDHDEYVQIPGRALSVVNGNYEIRVTEELREVSYLDKVQLIALDHPASVDIFTNDKFKSPPFPDFRLFGVTERHYPVAARDKRGRDVRSRLLRRDRIYPDGFARTYAGTAELHHLDLDFGRVARDNRAVLILSGWVDWADGSTFLAASQELDGGLVMPYLQVKDADGRWKTVIEDTGIPAGKPKTIAVDLTGKFLSDAREIRIVTNLCVYWDEVFLGESSSAPEARMTAVAPSAADLNFRGFSTPVVHPERKQPETFDYGRPLPLSMWNPTPGRYTRYGDVRQIIETVDDRLVIMGSGDELRLLFPAASLPALPSGWSRDFLLLVDGWAKDGDPNTAFSQNVEPLPFHGMSSYPYAAGEQFPDDSEHRAYRQIYNTRPALRLLRPLAEQRTR